MLVSYIILLASRRKTKTKNRHGQTEKKIGSCRKGDGVWLSLARVLDLGSRGRRFESCHPDCIRDDT